jgi:hypothetical protein
MAARERSFRASVLSSTRMAPSSSKAWASMSCFASTLIPVPQVAGVSHVQPISRRRWAGTIAR